jgi:hypothetical protein
MRVEHAGPAGSASIRRGAAVAFWLAIRRAPQKPDFGAEGLLPEFVDDYVAEDNPVWAIDVFVDELDLP